MRQPIKTLRSSFLIGLTFWLAVGALGAIGDMIANDDYTTNPVYTLGRFGFYYGWVVVIWWPVLLTLSILPPLVIGLITAIRVGYKRWSRIK
ncbi:hypothetical protein GCM10027348_42740 [Hymenobacter tenuis]